MIEFKEKEYTLSTFMKAMREVGDTLSYVGTYFESPLLDSNIIATPTLGVDLDKSGILELVVTLKPNVGNEVEQVKVLEKYVSVLNMGFINAKADPFKAKNAHRTPISKFLAQNSMTSEIRDYDLSVLMSDPVVTRMETVINGVKYWKFTLQETYDFGDDVGYTHKVHALVKEKTSDAETFFSAMVGADLSRRDSLKVLESIAGNNISGLFIGGFRSHALVAESKRSYINFYGTTDNISIRKANKAYIIHLHNGGTIVPYEAIKKVSVSRASEGKYTVTIHADGMDTELFLG